MCESDFVDITPNKDGGILKKIIRTGKFPSMANKGDTVYVHYTGTLTENGKKFDSSRDRGEEFSFTLGSGQVIKGWDIGVGTMKVGEKAILRCRHDYAYGEHGSGSSIPPNATLDFEIEFLRFTGEDISPQRDGSITKSIIVEGEKYHTPAEFAEINAHIVGHYNGTVFYERELTYNLGEGEAYDLPVGVDVAIRRFKKGEKSKVILSGGSHTYGLHPPKEFNLPPNAKIEFEIFLKDFLPEKHSWEMTTAEKLNAALMAKEKGTKYLQEERLNLALNLYNRCISLIENLKEVEGDLETQWKQTCIAGRLNAALVHLKNKSYSECIHQCDKVLEIDSKNVKALYRKGQGYQQRKDYDDAISVYNKVLEIEPHNTAAINNLKICTKEKQDYAAKEKQRFSRLFEKMAKTNNEEKKSESDVTTTTEEAKA
uniref:peptidylprolyl isomerase n=1 Tax=Strongyloides venezuelensis TaxID=75913 RepID=A0A0K0FZ66_STRVS